ncbi:MAG: hypothetical protein ACUVQS_02775 [Candidatus Bipolaricaulaceae bacterium]
MEPKGVRVHALMAVLSALVVVGAAAGEVYPTSFSCTGQMKGEVCWLTDARLYAIASWRFEVLTPGAWTLILEGLREDPCAGPGCERDVTVQVFWREAFDQAWNWSFVQLREPGLGAGTVRAEIPLNLSGPELFVVVRRALLCEPFLGFSRVSAHLQPPALETIPLPPPPEPLPPPPEVTPPPPPPISACRIGALFGCAPGPIPSECIPRDLDLLAVPRVTLGETYGPSDAQLLDLGHYSGEMGPDDYQDWYKFSIPKGGGYLVYFEAFGDLVVDLYLVHDPCGTTLSACLGVVGSAVLSAPCQAGVECVTIPDGLAECFRGEQCGFFVRIVRRSGSGFYYLSLLPAELAP